MEVYSYTYHCSLEIVCNCIQDLLINQRSVSNNQLDEQSTLAPELHQKEILIEELRNEIEVHT